MKKINILYLEDNPSDSMLVETMLNRSSLVCEIVLVDTKEKFETALSNSNFDLVLSDYRIPNYNGLEALKYTKERYPELPFILLSGTIGEEKAIEMFETGVTDFITKNNLQRLLPAIARAINEVDEINKRKISEEKLKANELLFHQFTENIQEVFWRGTPRLDKIIYVSPAFERIWGFKTEELYENPRAWFDAILPEDQPKVKDAFFLMIEKSRSHAEIEYKIKRPDGQIRVILDRGTLLLDENNNAIGMIGFALDITILATFRDQLQKNLIEKEVMLKEIYHRVKNNLQVVSSLLNLQANSISDSVYKKIFLESSARVKSMALVHEMLYQSGSLSLIEMQSYIDNLTQYLTEIFHTNTRLVKIISDVKSVQLSLDEAIPCGLIVNELISNSLKYAFPNDRSGEIKISIKKDNDQILLQVSDNGVGFVPNFDFKNYPSLGIKLIHALAKQLGGVIKFENGHGTKFSLTFTRK